MQEPLSIGQMTEKYEVTTRLLHFYEAKGLLNPERVDNPAGYQDRFYNEMQQRRLEVIQKFTRAGVRLNDVRKFTDAFPGAASMPNPGHWSEDAQGEAFAVLMETRKRLRAEEKKIADQLGETRNFRELLNLMPD
jgi:DNA-binding transcriptional MerR regulator